MEEANMTRKLGLLLAAVATLAFALPAFASAATGITEAGALITTPRIITFTNIGTMTITSAKTGTIPCQNVMLEAELASNSGAGVVATEGGSQSITTCVRNGAGISVKNTRLSTVKTSGGGTGTVALSFDWELSKTLSCHFVGNADTFTYNPTETSEGGDVITISGGPMEVTPAACGESARLDVELTLTTQSTTTPVYLM
jgi:hypothetical protein